jgi:uncharacterized repeat protein (TIGR03803 family)
VFCVSPPSAGAGAKPALQWSYSFTGGFDGGTPTGRLVFGPDGNVYGATAYGGANELGALFGITPPSSPNNGPSMAWTYAFQSLDDYGNNYPGAYPSSGLVLGPDGNLYGTTTSAGLGGGGTVFSIAPGHSFVNWAYSFSPLDFNGDNEDGSKPGAEVVFGANGHLYGTTGSGGANENGAIFEIDPATAEFVWSYSFSALDAINENSEGSTPYSSLVFGADGNLYGAGSRGGLNGSGALFSIAPGGSSVTWTYSFTGASDGGGPAAPLTLGSDGNFYGTTEFGGSANNGVVFAIGPGASSLAWTNSLSAANSAPEGELIFDPAGELIGTTQAGGTFQNGTVFSATPGSTGVKWSFSLDSTFYTNGLSPLGRLVFGKDGNLYGTAAEGGTGNAGTVFDFSPATGQFLWVYSLDGSTANLPGGLVFGPDGNLYVAAAGGGANSSGAIFSIAPGGSSPIWIYAFSGVDGNGYNIDGSGPNADLAFGPDGKLYGTTQTGGANGYGTVFSITPGSPATSWSYAFTNGADGAYPYAGIVFGPDGNLCGTTSRGGTNDYGAVYSIAPGATEIAWSYSFNYDNDGADPEAPVIIDADGLVYGTASAGGANDEGTVFCLNPANSSGPSLGWAYSFGSTRDPSGDPVDGKKPEAGLIFGNDGNLYATTTEEPGGSGVVFSLAPPNPGNGNTPTLVWSYLFGSTAGDGATPMAPVTFDTEGNLLGCASQGGPADAGTVFKLSNPGATVKPGDSVVANRSYYEMAGEIVGVSPGGAESLLCTALYDSYTTAMDAAGNILVACYQTPDAYFNQSGTVNDGGIFKLNPYRVELTCVSGNTNFATPFGLALEPGGSVLVADLDANVSGAIFRVNPFNGVATTLSTGGNFYWLGGIAVGTINMAEAIFVTDHGNGAPKVLQIDPASGAQTVLVSGGPLAHPDGLAIDADGGLIVADSGAGGLFKVTNNGGVWSVAPVTVSGASFAYPTHVAVDPSSGDYLVTDGAPSTPANATAGALYRVDATTGVATLVTSGGFFEQPRGLAIMP